jgi:hypothetical protein
LTRTEEDDYVKNRRVERKIINKSAELLDLLRIIQEHQIFLSLVMWMIEQQKSRTNSLYKSQPLPSSLALLLYQFSSVRMSDCGRTSPRCIYHSLSKCGAYHGKKGPCDNRFSVDIVRTIAPVGSKAPAEP